tara:strand:- start:4369 stop:4902 length:534 start_codon:yes stop_codon:yes gene_type:complete
MPYSNGDTFSPTTGIAIERLLDGESVATNQNPTGLGPSNAIQVEFGPAVLTGSDPVNLDATGSLFINTAGTYRIKVSFQFSRSGNTGVSELLFRVTDGLGNQLGRSIAAFINSANDEIYIENDTWLTLPAGIELKFELMRDSNGNDSGGLTRYTPTVDGGDEWNHAPCAAIRVERWV